MKIFHPFLHQVRSLPEWTKKFFSLFCLTAAAFFIFQLWAESSVPYEISLRSAGRPATETPVRGAPKFPELSAEEKEVLGPLAGVGELLKSLEEFLAGYRVYLPEPGLASATLYGTYFKTISRITDTLEAGWNAIRNFEKSAEKWAVRNILGVRVEE